MLIKSLAGEFKVTVERFETEGRDLVMVGKMGVWDARMYIPARELMSVFGKLLRPRVMGYLLRAPFLLLGRASGEAKSGEKP